MSKRSNPLLVTLAVLARVGVGVLLLGVAIGVYQLLQSTKIEPEPIEQTLTAAPVRAIVAPELVVPREIEGFGTARAMDASVVSAQVSARVVERPDAIEPGNAVDEGQLIVRLEPADFESRVESGRQRIVAVRAQLAALEAERVQLDNQIHLAEQEIEIDKRDLARIEQAVEGGSGTQADVDVRLAALRRSERAVEALKQAWVQFGPRAEQLEAELGTLRATLALDEQDLERARVVAPIAGRLQTVDVEPGEFLRVGDRVARVVNLDRVEVPLRVPVSTASLITIGDTAELRGDGPGSGAWTGEVTRIAPESDASTRTLTVFVEVEQAGADRPLLPGQFVMGRVRASSEAPAVLVPRKAVVGDRVLVARGNSPYRVEPVDVRVSHFIEMELPGTNPGERQWAVLVDGPEGGLVRGELVIISNLDELIGGMPVEPALPDGVATGGAGGSGEEE